MVTTALNLNLTPGGVPLNLHVTQYDAGFRTYEFTPYSSPGTVDLSLASSVTLEATKPDGHAIINNCTYDSGTNKITYTVQQQLCACIGKVWSKVVIRDTNDNVLGTAAVIWIVEPAGVNDGAIMSDSDISAMEEFVAEFGSINAYKTALDACLAAAGGTRVASTVAGMTDHNYVYVYTGSETGYIAGNWYYWNGSAWASGGVYQANYNLDTTLTQSGKAADAKAVGDGLDELKSDLISIQDLDWFDLIGSISWEVGTISAQTGADQAASNRIRCIGYLDISKNKTIKFTIQSGYKYVFDTYDSSKNLANEQGGGSWNTTNKEITFSSSVSYIRFLVANTSDTAASVAFADNFTAEYGTTFNTTMDNLKLVTEEDNTSIKKAGISYYTGAVSFDTFGNKFLYYKFIAGDIISMTATLSGTTSDGGVAFQIYDDDNTRLALLYGTGTAKLFITNDTDYLKINVSRTGTWSNFGVDFTFTLAQRAVAPRIYHVEKNGSGDFTKLVDAVAEATKYENSLVYVGTGTWDVLSEFGDDYLSNVSSSPTTWGMTLKNNIHLIFSSGAIVTANYMGDNANVRTYFSVFNSGVGGFVLENCKIQSKNIRYCVHDDAGQTAPYVNKFINCNMYHDNSENTDFGGWGCIGGGFAKNGYIEIIGCVFDGKNQYDNRGGIVSYHNSSQANAQSVLVIKDCYFAGDFTVRISWYGSTTNISVAYISNCHLGEAIVHREENESALVENTSVVAWNNDIAT